MLPLIRDAVVTVKKGLDMVDNSRRILIRCLMRMIAKSEISAPFAMTILLGQPSFYSSHNVSYLPFLSAITKLHHDYQHLMHNVGLDAGENSLVVGNESSEETEEERAEDDEMSVCDEAADAVEGSHKGCGKTGELGVETDIDETVEVMFYKHTESTLGPPQLIAWNRLTDYILRPVSDPFNEMTMLEFYTRMIKTRKSQTAQNKAESHNSEMFHLDHPHAASHLVSLRKKHYIPILVGATIPKRNIANPAYCRAVLTLTIPWRKLSDLIHDGETWCSAYQRLLPTGKCSTNFHHNFIANTELTHTYDKSRASDLLAREERERIATADQQHHSVVSDNIENTVNVENVYDEFIVLASLLGEADLTADTETVIPTDIYFASAMTIVKSNVQVQHAESVIRRQDVAWMYKKYTSANITALHTSVQSEVKLLREQTIRDNSEPRDQQVRGAVMVEEVSIIKYAKRARLDREQTQLLIMVVEHAESMMLAVLSSEAKPKPLVAVITGEGGSGKSRVLRTLIDYFTLRGWRNLIYPTALTGSAAAELERGASTTDSFFSIMRSKKNQECRVDGLGSAQRSRLLGHKYIIIDEVSMLSAEKLFFIAQKLQVGNDNSSLDYPFGECSLIFAGDPLQFTPCNGKSIFQPLQMVLPEFTNLQYKSVANDFPLRCALGRIIWQNITNVIVLRKNYRATCTHLQQILGNLRTTGLTSDNIAALNQRVIQPGDFARKRCMSDPGTHVVVQRNNIRDKLNFMLVHHFGCVETVPLIVVTSKDETLDGQPVIPKFQTWIDSLLPEHVCEKLQRKMMLYEGMEVILNENIAPELGLANGSRGTVVNIIIDPHDRDATCGYIKTLGSMPLAIFVMFNCLPDRSLDPALPPKTIVITPVTKKIVWKRTHGNQSFVLHFKRTMIPVTPARVITDYKSQGRSFQQVVLDICPPQQRNYFGLALYVMLSRARTLPGIHLLRPVADTKKMREPLPKFLQDEVMRLNEVAERCSSAFWTPERTSEWTLQ